MEQRTRLEPVPEDFFILTQRVMVNGFCPKDFNFYEVDKYYLMRFLHTTRLHIAIQLGYKIDDMGVGGAFDWTYQYAHQLVVEALEQKHA